MALADRAKWEATSIPTLFHCWIGLIRINLFIDRSGWYYVNCSLDACGARKKFRVKGGVEAAKPVAIRIVQAAVLKMAEEWRD